MEELEVYCKAGCTKVKNTKVKVLVLSILAGFFIALAGYASTVVSYTIGNISVSKLLSALVFPIGLILVVLLKTELFTGNNLLVIPLCNKKIKIKDLLINWGIVYIGNLIGSIILAFLLSKGGVISSNELLVTAFIGIATKKISYSFITAFILGILCNILVCIAVYEATVSSSTIEKIFVIFIPIALFIMLGFEHSVANMFYLSIGAFLHNFNTVELLVNNLLPVTLGNIVGGSLIGLILYYTKKK